MLAGVQHHLDSPDVNVRTLGMLVAENLTEKLNLPVKDDAK